MRYDDETLRRMQLIELGILKDVDRVCREHGIVYWLDSGSALGAARHEGFIPWDDDIDIGMMRDDYERFLSIASVALGDRYELSEPTTSELHSAMFAKVWLRETKFYTVETLDAGIRQGVGIDIMPYDVLSADETIAQKQKRSCQLLQKLLYLYHSKNVVVPHGGLLGSFEKTACIVAHSLLKIFLSHDRLVDWFQRSALVGADNPGSMSTCMPYVSVGSYPTSALVPVGHRVFEDGQFPVPADLETYLEIMFGNWQELPPVEERRQHAPVELDLGVSG